MQTEHMFNPLIGIPLESLEWPHISNDLEK